MKNDHLVKTLRWATMVEMNPMRVIFLILGLNLISFAQEVAPYDVYPEVAAPYFRVRYEASSKEGELIFPVKYTVWIPPKVSRLRGLIVHQHGCGEGSCKSGLTGAWDLHWQALAEKHDCALMAPSYEQPEKADCQMWCDPRNGSGQSFQKSLVDLGKLSGHPELSTVPWALWGHSGGGHWAGGMSFLQPERIAAVWLRSGVPLLEANAERSHILPYNEIPSATLQIPIMCNPGTKEGVTVKTGRFSKTWEANEKFLVGMRAKDALIGVAIDPLTSHECGNQRYMAIAWFDACLSARLPLRSGEPMKLMPKDEGWLAPFLDKSASPASKFSGDKTKASWLPNEKIARIWSHYVNDTAIPDQSPPPAPTHLMVENNQLTWQANADLESGLSYFIINRDGEFLAKVEGPKNPFGRPVFQGLQYSDTPSFPLQEMRYVDTKQESGKHHQYQVVSVNSVGLKSN